LCFGPDVVCNAAGAVASGFSTFGQGVAHGAEAAGGFAYHHPLQTAGLALGAISLATGAGAIAGGIEIASLGIDLSATAAGTVSAAAGGIGVVIDTPGCVNQEAIACLAAGFNGLGAGLGGVGALVGEGVLGGLLGAFGVNVAAAGVTLDSVAAIEAFGEQQRELCS
jgi:hypothetical protein